MRKENGSEKEKASTLISEGEVARIIVENGPDKGKELLVDKSSVTIGRHPENDVCLPHDATISRFHGRIYFNKEERFFYYEDLNSTNGTTINDKWFKNEKMKIKHGDRILIGRGTQLRFITKKPGLKDWLLG
jgi:pSer/pThr/pTyr-binding forkhead associated (FHA) protein